MDHCTCFREQSAEHHDSRCGNAVDAKTKGNGADDTVGQPPDASDAPFRSKSLAKTFLVLKSSLARQASAAHEPIDGDSVCKWRRWLESKDGL